MAAKPEAAAGRTGGPPVAVRLEMLRLAGARHRLALAMALDDLRRESGHFGVARALWGAGKAVFGLAPGVTTVFQGLLSRSRWLAPVLGRALLGLGRRRSAALLRGVLEGGTLGIFLFGLARRMLRRRRR